MPAPSTEPLPFVERVRICLRAVYKFLSKNIAVITLVLVFPIILFPNHPGFALLYISKKFGTSLALSLIHI